MVLDALLRMAQLPLRRAEDFEFSKERAETVVKRGLCSTIDRVKRTKRKKRNKQARKSRALNAKRR